MQPIDREQAQKALDSILKVQRFKPLYVTLSLLQLALTVMLVMFLKWLIQLPLKLEDGYRNVFYITVGTCAIGVAIYQTVCLFFLGLTKNNKDILLTYLARRQLQADAAAEIADLERKK